MKTFIDKLKTLASVLITFILVVAFFGWHGRLFDDTLFFLNRLSILVFWCSIFIFFLLYKRGWDDFFKTTIGLSLIGFLLTMYLSACLLVNINYFTNSFGKTKEQTYSINAIARKGSNRNKHDFIKIKYHKKELWIRSPIDPLPRGKYRTIELKTSTGILGWEVIKEKKLN